MEYVIRGEHETHRTVVRNMQHVGDLHALARVVEFPPPLVRDHVDFSRRVISPSDVSRRQPHRSGRDEQDRAKYYAPS
jgi:hypothetical protein